MAVLKIEITKPVPADPQPRKFTVSGTYSQVPGGGPFRFIVKQVDVQFVLGGPKTKAELDKSSFRATGTVPQAVADGSTVRVTATASGYKYDPGKPTGPGLPDFQDFTESVSVDVLLQDHVVDVVTIDDFTTPVTPPTLPYVLPLGGTADDVSGIASVMVSVDGGAFEDTDSHTVTGTLWRWAKSVSLAAQLHTITVRATDKNGVHRHVSKVIEVRVPFEPGEVDQAFEPSHYLRELGPFSAPGRSEVRFAGRYVDAGAGVPLTAAMLAQRFCQPYDRITDPSVFEQATRPLPRSRIAIEVLRARLGSPPTGQLDQRFRTMTYQTTLVGLGTSYDELREARTAAPQTRQNLSDRLGLGSLPVRPDHLDDLLMAPDSVTDDQLERLFGFATTAPADPLGSVPGDGSVLLWQRGALGSRWVQEDQALRDGPDEAIPLIDPDIITEANLANAAPEDPARKRWDERTKWVADTLTAITQEAGAVGDPLARFDQLVSIHIGTLDVDGLAARDAEGEDIGPDLAGLELSLTALRILAHARAVLATTDLLDAEWEDVFSILVQVAKRRQFGDWRHQERQDSLVLAPASFRLDPSRPAGAGPAGQPSRWRFSASVRTEWVKTLQARIEQADALEARYQQVLHDTETQVLPALRDALVAEIGQRQPQPESQQEAAERLTRELMIDLQSSPGEGTTRVGQAIETLQAMLFSTRAGTLPAGDTGQAEWTIRAGKPGSLDFDTEWNWMGSYRSWLAATRVFAYPDNQLLPSLYVAQPLLDTPTAACRTLMEDLRKATRLSPEDARRLAGTYLTSMRAEAKAKGKLADHLDNYDLTDHYTDEALGQHLDWNDPQQKGMWSADPNDPNWPLRQQYREVFWLVPVALAQKLQESHQFRAALDWYRTVYAYHLPQKERRIFWGLQYEAATTSDYARPPEWLLDELNPHIFAQRRRNCYTRATIAMIASCFLAYGDDQFAQNTTQANAQARTLYQTALDLLNLPDVQQAADGAGGPFPENPVWAAARQQAQTSLDKVHRGLNIAGTANVFQTGGETTLPSHYRYPVLIERAKTLVGIAQQLEAAFLSTLEQRDAITYSAMQARHDLQVARVSLTIQDIKLAEARTGVQLAGLQRERAQVQEDYYTRQIDDGLNGYEKAALASLGTAAYLSAAAGTATGIGAAVLGALTFGLAGPKEAASALSEFAAAASTSAQLSQALAGFERREQEWRLQRSLASTDAEIGDQQIQLAQDQLLVAGQEGRIAELQFNHARAVADFLATKFLNADLFAWMSGVLGHVYAYFLQQATALAQLAEAQLAFERQEPITGFIQTDYWRDTTADTTSDTTSTTDRRGLTGSARLLQDVYRLDNYAFDTSRRKLHLTQTLSLAQLAARELQQFRETGVLTFATPEALFDRDFPGHYLRLIKQVKVSLIALIPPTRGVRAILSASGVSRAVAAQGPFGTVTMRREPESIAFTSPVNATGLFELEPETGVLLPFEGMGADTTWQLELPKAANPFDYRSIADVLLTIEYTALDSQEHRQEVIRSLGSSFSGDRTFSLRNQFPDAWYQLNNPDTVDDPQQRMRAVLPLTADDFPPYIRDLAVAQLTLFAVRDDTLLGELTLPALRHTTTDGQTTEAGPVHTVDGAIGTRRPGGAPWQVFIGANPAGNWELQIDDSAQTREWFTEGLIDDLALVFTLTGATPPW